MKYKAGDILKVNFYDLNDRHNDVPVYFHYGVVINDIPNSEGHIQGKYFHDNESFFFYNDVDTNYYGRKIFEKMNK